MIKIFTSSVFALFLITSNNAFSLVDFGGSQFKTQNITPKKNNFINVRSNNLNMRVSPNRINQGALRKGIINKRNTIIPVNRINQAIRNTNDGVILQSGSIGKSIDKDSILGQANQYNPALSKPGTVDPLWKSPASKYSISDEAVITPKPNGNKDVGWWTVDGADFKNSNNVNLDTGPDTFSPTGTQGNLKRPKGVQLKFIDGEWR